MTRDGSNDVEILLTFVILFATLQEDRMGDKATVFWSTFAAALVFFAVKPIAQKFGVPA